MASKSRFITIDTRQYASTEGDVANSQARQRRETDLNAYGANGYALLSTLVVPQENGIIIIDTLGTTEDGY
ncbi:hypothetical protein ACPW96_21700 [Micromonospora sp. DT81.3]|uniref:hypothetical protein n=1 Tax=Micromonospora sp. DT81.3 TaxID=3416523 RepID=UPI003CEC5CDE